MTALIVSRWCARVVVSRRVAACRGAINPSAIVVAGRLAVDRRRAFLWRVASNRDASALLSRRVCEVIKSRRTVATPTIATGALTGGRAGERRVRSACANHDATGRSRATAIVLLAIAVVIVVVRVDGVAARRERRDAAKHARRRLDTSPHSL